MLRLCALIFLAVLTVLMALLEIFAFDSSLFAAKTSFLNPTIVYILGDNAKSPALWSKNQGVYNLFLAAGLLWAAWCPNPAFRFQLASFFLGCVFIAGIYGGRTVNPLLYYLQSGSAAVVWIVAFLF